MSLKFDGRVAIVTGAGGGLGRAYALALAARGAKVVVNDLGGSTTGEGSDKRAADKVVDQIVKAGGEAVANYDSVVDGHKVVKTAIDKWGRVDIVVNNAGILRDVTFHKMRDKDWELLYQVHLKGTYAVTRAAWPHMRDNKFGRIVMVTSAAGLYGNFGQAHYSTVKMGIVGLANTLAKEGAKKNIKVNTIAPIAGSRMTETVLPPDLVKALKPDYVAPLVLYLGHEQCKETGSVFEVGAGWVAKVRLERSQGTFFPLNKNFTPEAVQRQWSQVTDFSSPSFPTSPQDSFAPVMGNLKNTSGGDAGAASNGAKNGAKNDKVDVEKALAHKFAPVEFSYTDRDTMLYALAVGVSTDPLDESDLRFTYEGHAQFSVLPTFGVIIPSTCLGGVVGMPGLKFNPMMLLHGEQYMELKKPLPSTAKLTNHAKVSAIYDKGKGALVLLDVSSRDSKGEEVVFNQYSLFIRGLGGFGGGKGPKAQSHNPPQRPPDVVQRDRILDNQALLYRLCGDTNPLHADPSMAAMGGFKQPILHGLCSFGFASRAVIKHFCGNDVSQFKSVRVRFVKHVFPGETLITEMWRVSPTQIVFRCKVAERGEYVLSNAVITLHGKEPVKAAGSSPALPSVASKGGFKADDVFNAMKGSLSPEMVKKVRATFRFDVKNSEGVKQSYFLDLKNGSGAVAVQDTANASKADCVLIISDKDIVPLMTGKLNPQSAFMRGKLKLKGNMMLAQKLTVLMDQNKAALKAAAKGQAGGASGPKGSFQATKVFEGMKANLTKEAVSQVQAVFRFDISNDKGEKGSWLVDLKRGSGSIQYHETDKAPKADCIFIMSDNDLVSLIGGKLNPQQAFMQGQLKLKGNMMLAQKLGVIMQKRSAL